METFANCEHLGVVVHLDGHRIDVLGAGDQQVHRESISFDRLDGGRIKQETGRTGGVRSRLSGIRGMIRRRPIRGSGIIDSRIIHTRIDRRDGGRLSGGRGIGGSHLRLVAQFDARSGADVDGALIDLVDLTAADDVGHDGKDNLIFGVILRGLAEQVLQDWNLGQAGDATELPGLLVFHNSAQQVGFAIFQANFMLNLALTDDGLADAADVGLTGDGGDVHRNLESDFTVGMHPRSDLRYSRRRRGIGTEYSPAG